MADVNRLGPLRHLRAEPNQFILHYKGGKIVQSGAGVAYWFNPLSAAIAQVPVEDNEATFLLNERSADFQQVTVQVTVIYRVVDYARAAARFNFAISLVGGSWVERPLEKVAAMWAAKALEPVRAYLSNEPVVEALRTGAERIRTSLDAMLRSDPEIADMGLALVSVQVAKISPSADVEKALQTPTREFIQGKADEAVFSRRAMAVEKERAIKENELATEIELARRQAQLIEQKYANDRLAIDQSAANEKARVQADLERQLLVSEAESEKARVAAAAVGRDYLERSRGETAGRRLWDELEAEKEAVRVALWKDTPQRVAAALAMQTAAAKLEKINHLNITPDLLKGVLDQIVAERG